MIGSTADMSTVTDSPLALNQIEDVCLAVANGDRASLKRLRELLRLETPPEFSRWAPDRRGAWTSGLEVTLDSFLRAKLTDEERLFLLELLALGYESVQFRDLTAAAARKAFPTYPDPAGLITALGIMDKALLPALIFHRWTAFALLYQARHCFHPAHGLGTIVEVDGFSGSVRIQFSSARNFPLAIALDSLVILAPDSELEKLILGRQKWNPALPVAAFRNIVTASVAPATRCTDAILGAMLTPRLVSEADFRRYLLGPQEPLPARVATTTTATVGTERGWHEARSLEELADILGRRGALTAEEPQVAATRDLFLRNGGKADQGFHFGMAVSLLWKLAGGTSAFTAFWQEIAPAAAIWQNDLLFAEVSDALPGKLALPWFEVTAHARGLPWLCGAAMILPHRLFSPLGKALEKTPGGIERLRTSAQERIRALNVSADVLLWLWRSDCPERELMADVNLVFKTLAKPVRGSYVKANKELRKLMFDDEEFQRFLLHEGEEDAVASLVSCIRHVVLLDSGDQQSLLVRIVRLFPELKHLVETRQTARPQAQAGQITSLRSFELRRRELDEVISVKIPANSRAIAHARGFGDLRENAEFKAAKEEQRLLRIRRAELERAIHEVQSFDFTASAPAGQVVPGCVVTLRLPDPRTETYTLLGLWDGDVEKHYISYDSPLGKTLVGKREGESAEMPGKGNAVVEKIVPLPAELLHWLRGEDLL